jgi:hypothetical protein
MKTGIINFNNSQLTTDPAPAVEGQMYYNTALHAFMYYNGTAWARVNAGPGQVVQMVYHQRQDEAACNTNIPSNNNSRTSLEGNLVLTKSITPTSNTSTLKIEVVINGGGVDSCVILMEGTTVLATSRASYHNNGGPLCPATLIYYMTNPGTSPLTFNVNYGSNGIGASINRGTSGSADNGKLVSSLTITEIAG